MHEPAVGLDLLGPVELRDVRDLPGTLVAAVASGA
jgi:hypothetical protein